jgi:hypothetical protein
MRNVHEAQQNCDCLNPWGRFVTLNDPDGNGWVIQQNAPGI